MKHPILAILVVFALGCGVGFTAPFRPGAMAPARVTDADVRAYMDKQSGAAQGRSWRFYFDYQRPSEKPVFAGWPEVIADPTMWDWYDHVVRRGDHKEWYWASEGWTHGSVVSLSGTTGSFIANSATSTCFLTSAATISGGGGSGWTRQ